MAFVSTILLYGRELVYVIAAVWLHAITLTETVTIKNEGGGIVRTLVNGAQRAAGTYNDAWNGRNDASALLPDGPYAYFITVTDGTHTMVWDLSNQYRTEGWQYSYPTVSSEFDPFNNKPLSLTYSFPRAGRVWVIFTARAEAVPCVAPDYCWKREEYQAAGTYTLRWAGIDDTGAVRTDLNRASVTNFVDHFPNNAVVLFGTKPVLSAVTVTPPFYGPAVGNQTISFTFTTYQSQSATVQVTFRNQASGSVLRTLSLINQAPGQVTLNWDGRADNGMWVAPGVYIITAAVVDGIGNGVSEQILTNVAY